MFKKYILATFLLIASCSNRPEILYCPNVVITPEYSHVTRFYGDQPHYRAEIVGFEGYCRYNPKTNLTVAMVSPIFEIARLSDAGGKKVSINYYANTSYNPEQLMGRQPHSFSIIVDNKNEKIVVTGDEISVPIPNEQPGYQINLEIALSRSQFMYNQQQGLAF